MTDSLGKPLSDCCNATILEFHTWPNTLKKWKEDWGQDLGAPFRDIAVCFNCRKECDIHYKLDTKHD